MNALTRLLAFTAGLMPENPLWAKGHYLGTLGTYTNAASPQTKPQKRTQADLMAMAAAQAKRDRKAAKRASTY